MADHRLCYIQGIQNIYERMAKELFSKLPGFYILSSSGELGTYDSDGNYKVDTVLTQRFSVFNIEFLQYYMDNPDAGGVRDGIIYKSALEKPWKSLTLLLETATLIQVYPMSGTRSKELTGFQKRNREKSVFRAMELFLDYRNEDAPGVPVFCPVLFDRNTQLNDYKSIVNKEELESGETVPVIEVLNLISKLPPAKKQSQPILELEKSIYKGVVKKGARKSADLGFSEDIEATTGDGSDEEAYSNIDKRAERELADFENRVKADTDPHQVHQWMLTPVQYVKGDFLRFFTQLRELDIDVLRLIASKSPKHGAAAGAVLLQRGKTDKWSFFLLEGELELEAVDGAKKTVRAGDDSTRNPISYLKPRMYTVRALTNVRFLWVHEALIETALKLQPKSKPESDSGLSILK